MNTLFYIIVSLIGLYIVVKLIAEKYSKWIAGVIVLLSGILAISALLTNGKQNFFAFTAGIFISAFITRFRKDSKK